MSAETRAARARAEYDPMYDKVRVSVSPEQGVIMHWGMPTMVRSMDGQAMVEPSADAYLPLQEDVARAIYEALGRYFGGDAVDARRLRADYDAERKRVDKFIDAAIRDGGR